MKKARNKRLRKNEKGKHGNTERNYHEKKKRTEEKLEKKRRKKEE
jgi:hypothetical protein